MTRMVMIHYDKIIMRNHNHHKNLRSLFQKKITKCLY